MPDVTINVKTLDSNTHSFTVSDSLSVQEFKASIESTVGVGGGQQRLIYCGKVLVDDKQLAEYDLNGKTIHLVVRAPPSNAPSSSSNSAAANADDATSGSASSGRRSAPPFGSAARVENGQLVGAWYLPSTLDPANIQSMVQGVISNLGDLGRNATVLSNEDGSAVDVHINLSHLAGPPAASPTNASGQGRSEQQQQQNLHGRFHAHANNFEVQQRVAQIRHLLQNIQLDLGELQRLSQEPTASSSRASNDPLANEPPSSDATPDHRSGESPMDTASTPTAEQANSNRTSTTTNTTTTSSSTRNDGQATNEPPPTLDAAAIAASAAASAAETAAQLARQAAAAVAATMYGSPHVAQVRTNIPAIFVHTRVGANGPGGSDNGTRTSTTTSSNTQTGPGDSTQNRSRPPPQSSALPNVSEFSARELADLLQSVREVESNYHQHLRNFEECLRKPDNESSGSPNSQIHRGVSSIMHQFGTIYYMLSELSVNFDRPAPRTVSLYPSIATVNATPLVSTRQPRSSSLPRGGSIRVSTSTTPGASTTNASTSAQRQPGMSQSSARIFPLVVTPLHASVEIIPSVATGVNVSTRTTSSTAPQQSRPAAPVARPAAVPSSSSTSSSTANSATQQSISSRLTSALESTMAPASISTANWQSAVPPAWVPVIASDLARQQSEPSAARTAFSEAYLNGLPKKKRRTDEDGSSGH